MKIAWIDCFAGISGDMTLGALLDCGMPVEYLTDEIKKLGLRNFSIDISTIVKNNITAKKVRILFDLSKQPDRKYQTIKTLIKKSDLSKNVQTKALKAFEILGRAEAKIHGIPLNEVHFHEVGAVDSIIDIVGSIIGFEYLKIDRIYASPVPLGTGFTNTEHGRMPVPSPAALEVLKGYPIVHRNSDFEMTTPTGATIIKLLSDGPLPDDLILTTQIIGYGAGTKEVKEWPNILRMVIGEAVKTDNTDELFIIETNIDDLNPELYPYIMTRLLKAEAKDVYLTPVIMKKGRPGTKITVLTEKSHISKMEKILFNETSTMGIRRYRVERTILNRESRQIETPFGLIGVKISEIDGREVIHAEYEECLKIAQDRGISLLDIYREIEALNKK